MEFGTIQKCSGKKTTPASALRRFGRAEASACEKEVKIGDGGTTGVKFGLNSSLIHY